MRVVKAAATYFLIVFSAGFILGLIRVPLLVPRMGARASELLEIPVMLVVVTWSAHRIAAQNLDLSRDRLLAVGALALFFMSTAELAMAMALSGQAAWEYVVSRDPVSGTAYLLALLLFAVAPYAFSCRLAAR